MTSALAAALVNFLWQGAAIGALAWLGFASSRSPRVRYLIGIAALALMAAAPVVTGVFFARSAAVHGPSSTVQGSLPFQVLGPTSGSVDPGRGTENGREPWTMDRGRWTFPAIPLDPRVAPLVLAVWMLGVVALSARLAFGWLGARRLTRQVSAAGASVQVVASRLIASLNIRARVRVVESVLVKVPAVVGAFKPFVLLPAAAMSGLSMEQVEALLAHELAHVRRHDYLVNLLQSAVETLLFYHPAVWLVSRRVRQERELCCDDLALAVCSDRVAYASELADLESLRAVPSPALAATGGSLLARVRRILGHDEISVLAGRSQSLAGVAILASIILLVGGQAARARALPPASPIDSSAKSKAEDSRRAEWSTTPPQAPQTAKPTQGVQGGVVGGVQGGVESGVVGGVPSGIASGIDGRVPGGVADDQASKAAPQQQVVGPFRVGDHIRIDLGPERDPDSVRHFVTVPPTGVLDTAGYPSQFAGLEFISGLKVAGETSTTIAAEIARRYRARNLPVPKLEVTFDDRSGAYVSRYVRGEAAPKPSVTVLGAVRTAGKVELPSDRMTLRNAIAAAGGLLPSAGPSLVIRQSGQEQRIATQGLRGESITSSDFKLNDGAVVVVGFDLEQAVTVQGAVRSPGRFSLLESQLTLRNAIAAAGGLQPSAGASIVIRRAGQPDDRIVTAGFMNSGNDWGLHDGDVVLVPPSLSVTVQGAVRAPGRIQMREDRMTISDAIAAAGGFQPSAGSRIWLKRPGAPDVMLSKAELLQGRVSDTKVQDGDTITVEFAQKFYVTGYVKTSTSEYNWEPGMTLQKAIALAGGVAEAGAINRIEIQRKDPKTGKFSKVTLDKNKMATPIQPDDVIKVPAKRM